MPVKKMIRKEWMMKGLRVVGPVDVPEVVLQIAEMLVKEMPIGFLPVVMALVKEPV